jgi:chitinase
MQLKLAFFLVFLLSVQCVFRNSKKSEVLSGGPCTGTTTINANTGATTTTSTTSTPTTTTTTSTPTTTTSTTSTTTTPTTTTTTTTPSGTSSYPVGVYFGNWKIYGRGFNVCNIPIDKVDRIFYGFWDPTSGECKLNDPWADVEKPGPIDGVCGSQNQVWDSPLKGNLYQLSQLRKRKPSLMVAASVGGWTYSPQFHNYLKNPADRARIVSTCVALMNQYSAAFNALDIDLEFPCLPNDGNCGWAITPTDNDRKYFADFMAEFRAALPAHIPLTIATSAAPIKVEALDFARLNLAVHSYNIMTYDFTSGSWGDAWTGHQSNAYLNRADPLATAHRNFGIDTAVELYIKAGCDPKKINIGVGFYGRGFAVAIGSQPAPFVKSLGGLKVGTWETNAFEYYDIKANYAGAGNANVFWDDVAKAPYIYDSAKGYYISYDDPRSIAAKVGLVRKYGLEGIFSWEISGDSPDFELTTAMRQ